MKVLMVTERYLPIWGGAENQLRQLIPHLIDRGSEVEIVTRCFHENMAAKENLGGVVVHRLGTPGTSVFAQLYFIICLFLFLLKAARTTDIYHSHGAVKMGAICWLVAFLCRKKNVAKIATAGHIPKMLTTISGRFILSLFKRSSAIISMTTEIDCELSTLGIPISKIHTITNGVDCSRFSSGSFEEKKAWQIEHHLPPDCQIILFSSRLVLRKGLDLLINCWADILRSCPASYLVIVGSGTDQPDSVEEEMRDRVEKDKLTNILFVGETESPEDYLSIADCFVFPSRQEGFPNALMEAMASQLPCVASRIGGVEAIVDDGETGVLFEPENSKDLAEKCKALLQSSEKKEVIGKNARQKMFSVFSFETIAERYVKLYSTLLE